MWHGYQRLILRPCATRIAHRALTRHDRLDGQGLGGGDAVERQGDGEGVARC
jgi:hypothetical protein